MKLCWPGRVEEMDLTLSDYIIYRREKQIEYGKNTVDYDRYIELVRREDRKDRMPRTPNKNRKYSRRQWDGLVKSWKQNIHNTVAALEAAEDKVTDWAEEVKTEDFDWADEVEAEESQ